MSAIMGEIVPCPLVSYPSDLRCQTTADSIKGRANKESMIAVIKGTPACGALRGVMVVKAVEILTTGKMSSEKLRDQCGLVARVGGCPRYRPVNVGHGPEEIALGGRTLPLALDLGKVVPPNG